MQYFGILEHYIYRRRVYTFAFIQCSSVKIINMTLRKFFYFGLVSIVLSSCSSKVEIEEDRGYHLYFLHSLPEQIRSFENRYSENDVDASCADLFVYVISLERASIGYTTPQPYYIDGDKGIEQQIRDYLDPNGDKYNGTMPIPVFYNTEGCKQIHISLYDKDDTFLSDLTELARFHYVTGASSSSDEVGMNLLIDTSKKLLGKIAIGTTIQEYLAYNPMVFALAHFIFPDLSKAAFDNGNYVKVEIELNDGTIISGCSLKEQQ